MKRQKIMVVEQAFRAIETLQDQVEALQKQVESILRLWEPAIPAGTECIEKGEAEE